MEPGQPQEPEPEQAQSSGGGWWGFLDKVKSTSQTWISAYKEDLQEFAGTMKADTKKVVDEVASKQPGVATAATTVTSTITTGLASVSSGISSLLRNVTDIVEDQFIPPAVPISRAAEQLQNPATFAENPSDADFEEWLNNFDLDAHRDEIGKIISNNSQIGDMYRSLVPSELTPQEFWARYYFRLEKNQQKEKKRHELLYKARNISEEDIKWDDDDVLVLDQPDYEEPLSPAPERAATPAAAKEATETVEITPIEPVEAFNPPEPVVEPATAPAIAPLSQAEPEPEQPEPESDSHPEAVAAEPDVAHVAAYVEPEAIAAPEEQEPVAAAVEQPITEAPVEEPPKPVLVKAEHVLPPEPELPWSPAPLPTHEHAPAPASPVAAEPKPASPTAVSTPSRLAPQPAEEEDDVFGWE